MSRPPLNPEFQRQLWLNWRPSLPLWTLGLVSLILALPWVLSNAAERLSNLGITALLGLWGATVVYGSVLAGRSLSEELRQHTWDWQRLSALSPWQMAWGKLLGSTLPAWLYAALFATVALFVASTWEVVIGVHQGGHLTALALLWGLGMQTWAMNSVLLGWNTSSRSAPTQRRSWVVFLLLLWLAPWPLLGLLRRNVLDGQTVWWWGWAISDMGLAYLLGGVLLALGLLALWRQLCQRLDVATLPWAWPLGLAVASATGAGITAGEHVPTSGAALWASHTAMLALLASAYIALQHMLDDARAWRQVQWCVQRQRWRDALTALPLWPVSWVLALAAALWAWAATAQLGWVLVLACLQLLRDALILTGFGLLRRRLKSPMGVFIVTWLVLNLLLPLLAQGVGGALVASTVQPLLALIWPQEHSQLLAPHWAWLVLAVQLLLAALWVGLCYRREVALDAVASADAPAAQAG